MLVAGLLTLGGCNTGQPPTSDTEPEDDALAWDPEEPDGTPHVETSDPCEVDELGDDVVFSDLEDGHVIGSPHTVTGCSTARSLRWQLLVHGESIAAGETEADGDGRHGDFAFTLEFDDDVFVGEEAVLEVADRDGKAEPLRVERLSVIATVDVGGEEP